MTPTFPCQQPGCKRQIRWMREAHLSGAFTVRCYECAQKARRTRKEAKK